MEIQANLALSLHSLPAYKSQGQPGNETLASAGTKNAVPTEKTLASPTEPVGNNAASQENSNRSEGDPQGQSERELAEIRRYIQQLASRDREVRNHEQAHVAAGGQYTGAPQYQYERGPDGVNYAVAGEVPISTGKEATPEATIRKAQTIRRAALAPAEPSSQDRRVAAMAVRMEAEARAEMAQAQRLAMEEEPEVSETAESEDEAQTNDLSSSPSVGGGAVLASEREFSPSPAAVPSIISSRIDHYLSNSGATNADAASILRAIA